LLQLSHGLLDFGEICMQCITDLQICNEIQGGNGPKVLIFKSF